MSGSLVRLVSRLKIASTLVMASCLAVGLAMSSSAASAGDRTLWFDSGRPNSEAFQAVNILANAATEGLEPSDYHALALQQSITQAAEGSALDDETITHLDAVLTTSMQRYLADLHFGRLDPRLLDENYSDPPQGRLEPFSYLQNAVLEHRLPAAIRDATPAAPAYARLRDALALYRELASDPRLETRLPPLPGKKLEVGHTYAGIAALTQRLVALGDLPADMSTPHRYTQDLVEGIRAFQERHGLATDGVVGKNTFEQLNISPAQRVRQIELTLERLRQTPLLRGPRMIEINIPEFMLRAYEINNGQVEIKLTSKVIVGKALDTRTPIFNEDMRYIEFSPYWNIPPSIELSEVIPRLRRDPGYFQQQGYEFVTLDGKVLTSLSAANLDAVSLGQMRIRQRPGPENPLGDIKFIFPNNENIYLHHTPAQLLFQRDRRDFSHGCIRVEDPVALAEFVLQDQPQWDEDRILAAMNKGTSSTLRLKEPLPVVITYATSVVEEDGRVYFFPDIYGQDELLDEALRQRTMDQNADLLHPVGLQ